MPRTFLALTVVMGMSFVVAVSDEPEDKNIQRTVPTIEFIIPDVKNTSLYTQNSPLTLQGNISRSLGWRQHIDFRIYHVLESGELYPQGGGAVDTDDKGVFGVQFLPPPEGWKPGLQRVYARVNGYPAVTGTAERKIKDQGLKLLPPEQLKRPAPQDSGVVIDTDDTDAGEFFMPPNASFRICGTFLPEERFRDARPEILYIKIVRRLPDGTLDKLIVGNIGSHVFRDTEGQDDAPWFVVEMDSPDRPGDYHISIEPRGGGKNLPPWEYDLHVENEPDK